MIISDLEPAAQQDCFRCGYSLVGIADDQACPECGLLAGRSRRGSDELHLARPRWLRRLSLGIWLILAAIIWPGAMWLAGLAGDSYTLYRLSNWLGELTGNRGAFHLLFEVPSVVLAPSPVTFFVGTFLLATREGYVPADLADKGRRRWLVACGLLPLLSLSLFIAMSTMRWANGWPPVVPHWIIFLACVVAAAPFPILLFRQLRSLAARARSAQLAEHCTIVGIGAAAALVISCLLYPLFDYTDAESQIGWITKSNFSLAVLLVPAVAACLFYGWALLLMIRFALAFRRASNEARHAWQRDDRSLAGAV